MRVEYPAERVSEEREKVITAYLRAARIPGFRPGKAPRGVVQKKFHDDIEKEVISRLVNAGCSEGMKKEELKVLRIQEIQDVSMNGDGSLTFRADLTLSPTFELPEYMGIAVKVPKAEVTDERLAAVLEDYRGRLAQFTDVEGRPLQMGDIAVLDYHGDIDGEPMTKVVAKDAAYLAENSDAWIEMKANGFLPGFCEELEGLTKGEKKKLTLRFPEDFPVNELSGIEANYHVELKDIKDRHLPELDDDFAGKISEGKSLEAVRTAIREQLQVELEEAVDNSKTNQIIEYLHANVDFELPRDVVNRMTQQRVNEMVERGQMKGLADDEILQHQHEILNSASRRARTEAKTRFLLIEIAKKEALSVTQRDLLTQAALFAQQRGKSPKRLLKEMKDSGALPAFEESILVSKALDFLKTNASVEETENDAGAPEAGDNTVA